MAQAEPKKKVVYLFGAGATHAELTMLLPTLTSEDKVQRKLGLLISHVSTRVIEKASLNRDFLKGVEFLQPRYLEAVEMAAGTSGSLNIELLISLIENSKIHHWERKTRLLRDFVQKDIEAVLTPARRARFYLHKALFELHNHSAMKDKEQLFGLISLNYDDVLDRAYEEFHGPAPYCLSLEKGFPVQIDIVPLLKLHGSFDWTRGVTIRGRRKRIEIIPLGSNKNYLHAPFSFIWNRALETLIGCDTLRVVGCSLSQNDTHLVDLLFKAYLERTPERMETLTIEIISSETAGEAIRRNYGFFPGVQSLTKLENNLIGDPNPPNAFLTWLARKSDRALGEGLEKTRYLKRLKQ
jgi:SIR2-like protein